jgi:methionine aminopeptidase
MVLAIEPMVNAGGPEVVLSPKTAGPRGRGTAALSAHFELSVAVTENGPRVLGDPASVAA